jgi:hypothetical protein
VRQGFSAEVSGDFGCDDGGGLPRGVLYCHRGPDGTWLPGGASSSGAGALTLLPGGASSSGAGALTLLPGADLDALTADWHGSPDWRDT